MKVLHINTFNTGGAAKACLRIHKALMEQGVESKVLLRNKTLNDAPEVYEIWDELSLVEKGKQYLAQKRLDKKHQNIIEKNGSVGELFSFPESIWDITSHPLYDWADIIHLHWVAGFLDYTTFFEKNDKKIVWTIHDEEPFSGGFHYPPKEPVSRYSKLIQEHLVLKKELVGSKQVTIVSPSHFLAEKSKESDLFVDCSHHVIKNCTNTDVFQFKEMKVVRDELNLPEGVKILLFVADNLDYPRKGYDLLREAIAPLLGHDLILCTVGSLTKPKEEEYIIHMGQMSSENQMNRIYAATDVLVVPSILDNLPNTISEALCSGTPVVATDVGGISEMLSNDFGIHCKPNSLALRYAIQNALNKDWDRKMISQLNHEIYTPDQCAKDYLSIYRNL